MFGFFLRTSTYLYLYRRYKKEIVRVLLSIVAIFVIYSIYSDLYTVFKVSNKEFLMPLLALKWILVGSIIVYNFYRLKKEFSNKNSISVQKQSFLEIPKKSTHHEDITSQKEDGILETKELLTTTDVLLKKYLKKSKES